MTNSSDPFLPESGSPDLSGSRRPADARENGIDERLFVASVEKAMRVLQAFDKDTDGLSLQDLTARTELGRSATQRFVYTLHQLGYLKRNAAAKTYSLSTKLIGLAGGMLSGNARLQHAYPIMAQLAKETGETVSWLELDDDEIVVLGNIPGVHLTSVNMPVGSRFPALPASSGQVLLAHAPKAQLLDMVARLAPDVRARFGDRDDEEILALLAKAQRNGYSMTEKNLGQGSVSISVPVYGPAGQVVAALNLSTLASRFDMEAARAQLLPLVLQSAGQLSTS
jgi:IclR family pca regulon transcriptional regulator